MGWLYMQSLGRFSSPRAYLDDQFTYERDDVRSTVLRSALVRMRTYYAAVEQLRVGAPRQVFALVCLVRYNPRARDGYIFGYKDMDETVGPCEAECPRAILDLLTSPANEHAAAWRARCLTAGRARSRSGLRAGQILVFPEPLIFSDGSAHLRLQVVRDPAAPRAIRFRPVGGSGLYRIGRLNARDFRIE